jgi:hypothetical protein
MSDINYSGTNRFIAENNIVRLGVHHIDKQDGKIDGKYFNCTISDQLKAGLKNAVTEASAKLAHNGVVSGPDMYGIQQEVLASVNSQLNNFAICKTAKPGDGLELE